MDQSPWNPFGFYAPVHHQNFSQPVDQSRGRHPAYHRNTAGPIFHNPTPVVSMPQPSINLPDILVPGGRSRAISSPTADFSFQSENRTNLYSMPPYLRPGFIKQPPPSVPPLPYCPPGYPLQPTSLSLSPVPPHADRLRLSSRSQSVPAPPAVPPKQIDTPPPVPQLPPKIPLYPTVIQDSHIQPSVRPHARSLYSQHHLPSLQPQVQPHTPAKSPPLPPKPPQISSSSAVAGEEEEFALALHLSVKESREQRSKLDEQEDEDLARAMRESLLQSHNHYPNQPDVTHQNNDSLQVLESPEFVAGTLSESPVPTATKFTTSSSSGPSNASSPNLTGTHASLVNSQITDDEALARRLAAEGGNSQEIKRRSQPLNPPTQHGNSLPQPGNHLPQPGNHPPQFSNRSPQFSNHRPESGNRPSHHPKLPVAEPSVPVASEFYNSVVVNATATPNLTIPVAHSSTSAVPSRPSTPRGRSSSTSVTVSSSLSQTAEASSSSEQSTSLSSTSKDEDEVVRSTSPLDPNQFIDDSLLKGISFGFNAPQIISVPTMLPGAIPNAISLETGKYLPFHVQALSWRHMLKLMARLSGTRIEASLETMASTKADLKLRAVIQFVKIHQASTDWRMILYLTIDSLPPINTPFAHRYTNGDVNVLPWTYTKSTLPTLLQLGTDSNLSKTYTVPSTNTTPYPSLPITLPNMAMYLNSVMEDSRRTIHDGSSGMRRLAKTVDTLYPNEQAPGMEDAENATRVGRVFKNMFGRGKNSRRNEDTWDLVTPFVPEY